MCLAATQNKPPTFFCSLQSPPTNLEWSAFLGSLPVFCMWWPVSDTSLKFPRQLQSKRKCCKRKPWTPGTGRCCCYFYWSSQRLRWMPSPPAISQQTASRSSSESLKIRWCGTRRLQCLQPPSVCGRWKGALPQNVTTCRWRLQEQLMHKEWAPLSRPSVGSLLIPNFIQEETSPRGSLPVSSCDIYTQGPDHSGSLITALFLLPLGSECAVHPDLVPHMLHLTNHRQGK